MSVARGLFVAGVDENDGTTPVEARLALAGLVTQSGDLGVTAGVISGGAVAGRSTAPTWAYTVTAGHFVLTRGATDGAVVIATDGATDTPVVSAAPATGSRWDLIWIRQRDVENADPDSNAVLGVTSGTSSGSPSKPYGSVPAGALVLAEAQVSAGASNTADPLVVITLAAPRVAARGGIIPLSSAADRDRLLIAGSPTAPVYIELGGSTYKSNGTSWRAVGTVTIAHESLPAKVTSAGGATWGTLLTASGWSAGGTVRATWDAVAVNGNSGLDRAVQYRVLCDGAVIGRGAYGPQSVPLAGMPKVFAGFHIEHAPTSGTHTWVLQSNATIASAVEIDAAALTIEERA